MMRSRRQTGASLVVSLIMLVVLTLIVVTAIRSSNTNLHIAGNMQNQAEANAAAQQVIEQVIDVRPAASAVDYTKITAEQTFSVTQGAAAYEVKVAKPVCENTVPVMSTDPSLSQNDADDKLCFEAADPGDPIIDADGNPIAKPTKCNQQNWHITATAKENSSSTKAIVHQGVGERKYTPTPC